MVRTRTRAWWRWLRLQWDEPSERTREAFALTTATLAFVLAGGVAGIVFAFRTAQIAGEGSIGWFAASSASLVAIGSFLFGSFLSAHASGRRMRFLDVVDTVVIAFAVGAIAGLTTLLLAEILSMGFVDAPVYTLPSMLIAGAVAGVTGYLAFVVGSIMDVQTLAVILLVFLLAGIIAATLHAKDPHWWKTNLSALGMEGTTSSPIFNTTIMVAGFLVTVLARYTTRDIATLRPRGVGKVRVLLVIIGIALIVVGAIPVNVSFWGHTGVASGMLVVFCVLALFVGRWIPGVPRSFVLISWVFCGVFLALVIFFAVGYYTLTAVEIVAGGLIFAWILLFIRIVGALANDVAARQKLAEA